MNLPLFVKMSNGEYVNLSLVSTVDEATTYGPIVEGQNKREKVPCLRMWGPACESPMISVTGDDMPRIREALDRLCQIGETHLPTKTEGSVDPAGND